MLQLDIILLLQRDDARWWNAEQIAEELRVGPNASAGALEALASSNLLDVRIGTALTYRYSPVQAGDRQLLTEIALDHYTARELVAGGDNVAAAARRFADAFRLRKTNG